MGCRARCISVSGPLTYYSTLAGVCVLKIPYIRRGQCHDRGVCKTAESDWHYEDMHVKIDGEKTKRV